jgi:hypothetical protein
MSTFNFSYKLTEEELLEASKLIYDYEYKNSLKRYIGWIFIAILQFGVVALMKKGSPALFLLSSVAVIYWYFLRWPIRKFFYKRLIKKSKVDQTTINIRIDERGVTINDYLIEWSKVTKVLSSKIGILLFISKEPILIPSKIIKNRETLEEFLKGKAKMYKKLTLS